MGCGTGRFAKELDVDYCLDISAKCLKLARRRGLNCILADASKTPFKNGVFKTVFLIYTLCFLTKPREVIKEAYRILAKEGCLIIAFTPKDSWLGEIYAKRRDSPFYKIAKLYSYNEVVKLCQNLGFKKVGEIATIPKTIGLQEFNIKCTRNYGFCAIKFQKY